MNKILIFLSFLLFVGLASCDRFSNDSPAPAQYPESSEINDNEIYDEYDGTARVAAIDTAVAVRVQVIVTGSCSSSGSAGFKYVEGNSSSLTLTAKQAVASAGYRTFDIGRSRFNKVLTKTLDKTKQYTVFCKAVDGKFYKMLTLPANPQAAKKLNKKGKPYGLPVTSAVTSLSCPPAALAAIPIITATAGYTFSLKVWDTYNLVFYLGTKAVKSIAGPTVVATSVTATKFTMTYPSLNGQWAEKADGSEFYFRESEDNLYFPTLEKISSDGNTATFILPAGIVGKTVTFTIA